MGELRKTAGTSDEMVALMNEGGFDLVTASGDASLRLIIGKRVQEVNIDLVPSWGKVDPRLQNAPWHTVGGKHYGVPYQWGSNVLMYNTDAFSEPPESWSVVFGETTLADGKSNKGLVKLAALAGRKPAQLSGGQRQRVALARALINHPRVLLLDEPLGALDLKLREEMQVELKAIQRQVGITFVYVTHDQAEALAMSDRLAVFNHGRIEQIGAPAEVYEHPETAFVAGFVGISNLLEGEVARAICGTADAFSIRPEKIRIVDHDAAVPDGCVSASGRIDDITYQGAISRYTVALDLGGSLIVTAQNLETTVADAASASGRTVRLVWRRDHNQPVGAGEGAT